MKKRRSYFVLGTVQDVYDRLFDGKTLLTGRKLKHGDKDGASIFPCYVYESEENGEKYFVVLVDDLIKAFHLPKDFFMSDQMLDACNTYQKRTGVFPIQKLTMNEIKPLINMED